MPSVVTKSDLVQVAAKAGNVSKAAAGEAVNALFEAIVDNVAKGKRVTVVGFGTFLPRKRKARAGRSPANGKEIKIPAKTLPAFAAVPATAQGNVYVMRHLDTPAGQPDPVTDPDALADGQPSPVTDRDPEALAEA